MVNRVLRGRRLNGSFGLDVSKPGIDVLTADKIGLAFCSDLKIPKVIARNTVYMSPTIGVGGKDWQIPGGQSTVLTIPFGATYAITPVCIAIAKAADWTVPLITNVPQLQYLQNRWHTPIVEMLQHTSPEQTFGDYGTLVTFQPGNAASNSISGSWASARFFISVTQSDFTITSNCRSVLTVKYLVLEYD